MGSGHVIDEFNGGGFKEVENFTAKDDKSAIEKFRKDYFSHIKYCSWYLALYHTDPNGKNTFLINND